jgi:tRNA(Phe) wybutosine-synthesizing methylase Tyw3
MEIQVTEQAKLEILRHLKQENAQLKDELEQAKQREAWLRGAAESTLLHVLARPEQYAGDIYKHFCVVWRVLKEPS